MINEKTGNVLNVESGIIVHGCNSHGVMGSGIAKEVKARFPEAFNVYRSEYEKAIASGLRGLPLGSITIARVGPAKYIVNAITQENYGRDPNVVYVSYPALKKAFELIKKSSDEMRSIASYYNEMLDCSVHFPVIGCGLANGDWNIVSKIIDDTLIEPEKTVWYFTP